jgi:hypothetical protein
MRHRVKVCQGSPAAGAQESPSEESTPVVCASPLSLLGDEQPKVQMTAANMRACFTEASLGIEIGVCKAAECSYDSQPCDMKLQIL